MTDINSLLLNPVGQEVAWDYCLEQNIILPADVPLQYWMQGVDSRAHSLGYSIPHSYHFFYSRSGFTHKYGSRSGLESARQSVTFCKRSRSNMI